MVNPNAFALQELVFVSEDSIKPCFFSPSLIFVKYVPQTVPLHAEFPFGSQDLAHGTTKVTQYTVNVQTWIFIFTEDHAGCPSYTRHGL